LVVHLNFVVLVVIDNHNWEVQFAGAVGNTRAGAGQVVRAQAHEAEDNEPKVLHVIDIAEHQYIHHGEDGEQSCRGGESTDILQAVGIEMVPLVRPAGHCSEGYIAGQVANFRQT
jgi:hypothetical protein